MGDTGSAAGEVVVKGAMSLGGFSAAPGAPSRGEPRGEQA